MHGRHAPNGTTPRGRLRLPTLTPEQVPGIEVFAHRYFETLDMKLPVATNRRLIPLGRAMQICSDEAGKVD